jgi:hypothetical protein
MHEFTFDMMVTNDSLTAGDMVMTAQQTNPVISEYSMKSCPLQSR